MANRSKKVVLSARVDPYLKAALELLAAAKREKIVKLIEISIENQLSDREVPTPFLFQTNEERRDKLGFMTVFEAIWSEDEPLFKLRAGILGPEIAGEETWMQAMTIIGDDYFKGDDDVFGDLNGLTKKFGYTVAVNQKVNLDLVRCEWSLVQAYVSFLENNKPFSPSYEDYKRMLKESQAK